MEFQEVKIPVPWGHIAGKWWGSQNQQPILAVHGWQDNAGSFDRLAPLLATDGHSVLCIDLPGHGLSSRYPDGMFYYIFWDGLIIVRRIVKHFGWEKVVLLGHSLGGAVSFLYASSFPDEIDRYISIDIVSPTVRQPETTVAKTGDCIDKLLKYEKLEENDIPSYNYNEMVDIVVDGYGGSINRESCKILMKRGSTITLNCSETCRLSFSRDLRLKVAGLGSISLDLVLEYAKRIKCKVLNIRAKPGMKFEKPENYYLVLDQIKKNADLEFHEIEGTHHLHLNDPESVYGVISNFLIK